MRLLPLLLALTVLPVGAASTDYCQLPGGSLTLLVVDRTSPFDAKDRALFAEGVAQVFERLQPGDRLEAHTLGADHGASQRVFAACKPGCPEQGFVAQMLGECRDMQARRDALAVRARLVRELGALLDAREEHAASAIIETLAAVRRQYARPPARLVLYSDLLENSAQGHFSRKGIPDAEVLLDKLKARQLLPDWGGVQVQVFGFGRGHDAQRRGLPPEGLKSLEAFWQAYFQRSGSAAVQIGSNLIAR
jgi:hypothetical protein